jgi:hypothetical protein
VLCTASGRPWNWNPGLYVLQSFGDHRTRRWHVSTMNSRRNLYPYPDEKDNGTENLVSLALRDALRF